MANPPADGSKELEKAEDEVEATAKGVRQKISEARKVIGGKLAEARLLRWLLDLR